LTSDLIDIHQERDQHFARLALDFADLWGRWPTLIDWHNVFCEVSKYTGPPTRMSEAVD